MGRGLVFTSQWPSLYSRRMWGFFRRQILYFLLGFVATFVIYIFARFDTDTVILGLIISALVGVVLSGVLFYFERRFPDRTPG